MIGSRHAVFLAVRQAMSFLSRLLDRASESGIAQLSATSLALLGLYEAASLILFTDRHVGVASFGTAFDVAHPAVWGAAYAGASLVLLLGSMRDRAFTVGATLALCAVYAVFGVLTIFPIVAGRGLPTDLSHYIGSGVWCFITMLMWRLRVRGRG